ncbi:MAG: type II toxin-antitoxin system VapC family toxin [Actinomycetota bacterium]|nr:type II toxin-antitoxin system VapC family toxin [Actinomycetota bacterium]
MHFLAARGSLAGRISIGEDFELTEVPDELHQHIVRSGLRILGLTPDHGLGVADLPMHHRDPFDRLLISQALAEGLTVMTANARLADYDVPLIDSRA